MTRTDRVIAALVAEIERHRASIDSDCGLHTVSVMVNLNDGGFPRRTTIERKSASELTAAMRS